MQLSRNNSTTAIKTFFFFFTTVLSYWNFSHGKFGLLSPGKVSFDRAALLNLRCMLVVFSLIRRTLAWTTGSLTCAQMSMHAIVHRAVRTSSESLHWKLTLGEKYLAAPGIGTYLSSVPVRRFTNWATSLHLPPLTSNRHLYSFELSKSAEVVKLTAAPKLSKGVFIHYLKSLLPLIKVGIPMRDELQWRVDYKVPRDRALKPPGDDNHESFKVLADGKHVRKKQFGSRILRTRRTIRCELDTSVFDISMQNTDCFFHGLRIIK